MIDGYRVTHLVDENLLLTWFRHFAWAVTEAAHQLTELTKHKSTGGFHQ